MKFKILDLFSGAGGFSYGLDSLQQFKTKVALDFDKSAIETFTKNFPDATAICGDITSKFVKEEIIQLARKANINMVIGGPPCQGFSLKGKNLGLKDERNFLFREFLNIVDELQPEIFIIENVKNMYNAANGYFRREIIHTIKRMGYLVNIGILNAKHYGVAQNRERTFVIASKNKKLNFPEPTCEIITVRDAIYDLAFLESGQGSFKSRYQTPPLSEYAKKLRDNNNILYNHIATNHSQLALEKLRMIPPEKGKEYLPKGMRGRQKFSTTWSRLEWDKVSPTIDTRFDTPSNGKNSHPYLHRSITPREAARIQSFPDNFVFYGAKTAVCRQIGNAVPPLLAKAIGEQIIEDMSSDVVKNKNVELLLGNAYTVIDELVRRNTVVDHIITDPPYNISVNNNFNTLNKPRKGIDFGQWDKGFDLTSWIYNYEKILNKNGSIIIFCSYKYISYIVDAMTQSNIIPKDILVWQKSNPMPRNTNRRYVQDMEFAIWGVKKGAKWVFNKKDSVPYMRGFFTSPTVLGKERTQHPTQKSLKVMEEIISIHTNKGDVILDPFMGSGTTGVAALKQGRRFIGIEVNKEYFDISKERILDYDKTQILQHSLL